MTLRKAARSWGGEPVENPGQGLGGAVEPFLDEGVLGGRDLDDGAPPVT